MQQLHFGGCVSVRDRFACQTIGLNRCVNEANTVLHKGLTSHCVYMYINAQKYSQYCGTSLPKAKYLVQGTTDFTIFKTAIVQYKI